MPRFDYSSPFLAVAMVTPDAASSTGRNRFPFWTNVFQKSQVRPEDLASDLPSMPWVQECTVEIDLGNVPKMSVQLTPTFREGMAFLDSDEFQWGQSTLEIQFGYAGANPVLSLPFSGIMLKPDVQIGADITITLNAQGTGGFSAFRQHGGRTNQEGEKRIQLMKRIAGGPTGTRNLVIDDNDARNDLEVSSLLNEEIQYAQGNKTDWLALWELANGARCDMVQAGKDSQGKNKLVLVSRRRATSETTPKRAFRLYDLNDGRINAQTSVGEGTQGEYPILSFSSPTMAVFIPDGVRGHLMREVSASDRSVTTETVGNETEQVARTGANGAQAPPEDDNALPGTNADGDGMDQTPGDPEDNQARRAVQAEYERFSNMGVEIEIETLGVPDLIPGELISVFGVGERFSSQNYAVKRLVHTIGSGGFSTTISAISNIGQLVQGALPAQGPASTALFDPNERVSEEDIQADPTSIIDDPDPLAGLL